MKIPTLTLLFLLNFMSCSTSNANKNDQNDQRWSLVKMTGNMINSETTGRAMQWQEDYLLKADGTFTKSRISKDKTETASGTYTYIELADGMYLELKHATINSLIGNCTGDLKEVLKVISVKEMRGTWLACDGPGLIYNKIK